MDAKQERMNQSQTTFLHKPVITARIGQGVEHGRAGKILGLIGYRTCAAAIVVSQPSACKFEGPYYGTGKGL